MTSSSQQGSLSDLSLFSSPSMPNISLGRPHVPSGSNTVSRSIDNYNRSITLLLKKTTIFHLSYGADRYEIGHGLGGGGTRSVHRAARNAAHGTNVARHPAFLSIVDGNRGRRGNVDRWLRSQADAAKFGTSIGNESATSTVRGLSR